MIAWPSCETQCLFSESGISLGSGGSSPPSMVDGFTQTTLGRPSKRVGSGVVRLSDSGVSSDYSLPLTVSTSTATTLPDSDLLSTDVSESPALLRCGGSLVCCTEKQRKSAWRLASVRQINCISIQWNKTTFHVECKSPEDEPQKLLSNLSSCGQWAFFKARVCFLCRCSSRPKNDSRHCPCLGRQASEAFPHTNLKHKTVLGSFQ